jgi:hypothetical protein
MKIRRHDYQLFDGSRLYMKKPGEVGIPNCVVGRCLFPYMRPGDAMLNKIRRACDRLENRESVGLKWRRSMYGACAQADNWIESVAQSGGHPQALLYPRMWFAAAVQATTWHDNSSV